MPEPPPEELIYAVKGQAEARLRMDVSAFAKYLTPEAVESLRASFPGLPPRVNAYEIEKHEPRGADHVFDVRYSARADTFVVRSRWRKLDGGWMVVHAERLWTEGQKRPGVVSRVLGSIVRALTGLRRR
jgi:hypothetical protein